MTMMSKGADFEPLVKPEPKNSKQDPSDTYNIVYLVFVLYGAAVLTPWNVVSSCFDYFLLFDSSQANPSLISTYTFATNGLTIAGMCFVFIKGRDISYEVRISGFFVIMGCILLAVPLVAAIGGPLGFWLTFCVLMCLGFCNGVALASVFGLGGGMPFRFMAGVMLGNGIVGIMCNLIRGATYKAFPPVGGKEKEAAFKSAIIFFLIAVGFLWSCAGLMHCCLKKNKCYNYHFQRMIESTSLLPEPLSDSLN